MSFVQLWILRSASLLCRAQSSSGPACAGGLTARTPSAQTTANAVTWRTMLSPKCIRYDDHSLFSSTWSAGPSWSTPIGLEGYAGDAGDDHRVPSGQRATETCVVAPLFCCAIVLHSAAEMGRASKVQLRGVGGTTGLVAAGEAQAARGRA